MTVAEAPAFRVGRGMDLGDSQRAEILDLLTVGFGSWPAADVPSAAEHLDWKLEGAPGRPTLVLLGEDAGRIVFFNAQWDLPYRVDGVERRVRMGMDSCVHPDYRGRGFNTLRMRHAHEQFSPIFDLLLSYSVSPQINRSSAKYLEMMKPANGPLHLVRVLRPKGMAEDVQDSLPRLPRFGVSAALAGMDLLARVGSAGSAGSVDGSLRTADSFDERVDALFESAAGAFVFIGVRSAELLNWRFADARAGTYTIRLVESGDRLLGYSVLSLGRQSRVLDLLTEGNRPDVADLLVADAVGAAKEAGASRIDCWLPRVHPYARILRRHRFTSWLPYDPALRLSRESLPRQKTASLLDPTAPVHLTMADADYT